jgi:hypothetical protein
VTPTETPTENGGSFTKSNLILKFKMQCKYVKRSNLGLSLIKLSIVFSDRIIETAQSYRLQLSHS